MSDFLGTIACLVVLAWLALRWHARATRAEQAVEELKAQMMRGASVAKWQRPKPAPGADAWYYHVKTSRGDLLLTQEAFAVARGRADGLFQ